MNKRTTIVCSIIATIAFATIAFLGWALNPGAHPDDNTMTMMALYFICSFYVAVPLICFITNLLVFRKKAWGHVAFMFFFSIAALLLPLFSFQSMNFSSLAVYALFSVVPAIAGALLGIICRKMKEKSAAVA